MRWWFTTWIRRERKGKDQGQGTEASRPPEGLGFWTIKNLQIYRRLAQEEVILHGTTNAYYFCAVPLSFAWRSGPSPSWRVLPGPRRRRRQSWVWCSPTPPFVIFGRSGGAGAPNTDFETSFADSQTRHLLLLFEVPSIRRQAQQAHSSHARLNSQIRHPLLHLSPADHRVLDPGGRVEERIHGVPLELPQHANGLNLGRPEELPLELKGVSFCRLGTSAARNALGVGAVRNSGLEQNELVPLELNPVLVVSQRFLRLRKKEEENDKKRGEEGVR